MVRFTSHFGEESGTRGELEAKRMALAEKLMVHGALAQRTCMAANFAFWGFSEVRHNGVLRRSRIAAVQHP